MIDETEGELQTLGLRSTLQDWRLYIPHRAKQKRRALSRASEIQRIVSVGTRPCPCKVAINIQLLKHLTSTAASTHAIIHSHQHHTSGVVKLYYWGSTVTLFISPRYSSCRR